MGTNKKTKKVKLSNIDKIFGRQTSDELIDKILLSTKTILLTIERKESIIISKMLKELYSKNYVQKNTKLH